MLLDAKDVKTNRAVCIKMIRKKTSELEIGRYLVPHSPDTPQCSRNHCVPIVDAFHDSTIHEVRYIVMPLLRSFDDPEFGAIGEIVDFVTQVLEVSGTSKFYSAYTTTRHRAQNICIGNSLHIGR